MCHYKACGSQDVTQHSETESVRYRKGTVEATLAYCVCNACGRDFVPPELIRKNDEALRAAKRAYDGLLAPEEIHEARRALGLTQEEAAEVFGGGANAFSKYERGEVSQSAAMDRLIRLCVNHPELVNEIRSGFVELSMLKKVDVVGESILEDWHTESYPANDAVYFAGAQERHVPSLEAGYE